MYIYFWMRGSHRSPPWWRPFSHWPEEQGPDPSSVRPVNYTYKGVISGIQIDPGLLAPLPGSEPGTVFQF